MVRFFLLLYTDVMSFSSQHMHLYHSFVVYSDISLSFSAKGKSKDVKSLARW